MADGRDLLVEVVRDGLDVTAAAWGQWEEGGLWTLYVGCPAVAAGRDAAYALVYEGLTRVPDVVIGPSDIRLYDAAHPVIRDMVAVRDRRAAGRRGVWVADRKLGDLHFERAYIYPCITAGLTRREVVAAVSDLLERADPEWQAVVTLRDGTVVRGTPVGLEVNRAAGRPGALDIKIWDDATSATRVVSADEVANIQ